MAVAHYLDALAWQRQVAQLQAIFGGKNPHPNVLVGGAPSAISVHTGAGTATTAVNIVGLQQVSAIIDRMRTFVDQVYLPDILAIGSFYKDWFKTGLRRGTGNFMTYGDFPALREPGSEDLSGAARRHSRPRSIPHSGGRPHGEADIQDSWPPWYDYSGGQGHGLHPSRGETRFELFGPALALPESGHSASYLGSSRRAGKGTPWRSGRWHGCSIVVCERKRTHPGLAHKTLSDLNLAAGPALFSTWAGPAAAHWNARFSPDTSRSGTPRHGEHPCRGRAHLQRGSVGAGRLGHDMRGGGFLEAPAARGTLDRDR